MQPQRPSRTAEGAAALRAWHLLVDDEPPVFEDHAVFDLLGTPTRLLLTAPPTPLRRALIARERMRPELAALRGQVVVRARYADDVIAAAVADGVDQIVILAAGLDTTALRRHDLLRSARLFEVDHPATQAWKRQRLGPGAAERIRFAAVDFEQDDPGEVLVAAGLDPQRRSVVNWLGCSYYLTPRAIRGTLTALARVMPTGSRIVLDYWTPEWTTQWRSRLLLSGIRFAVALQREPLRALLTPVDLAALLRETGWRIAEDLGPSRQRDRWLRGRRDGLSLPGFARLAMLEREADA